LYCWSSAKVGMFLTDLFLPCCSWLFSSPSCLTFAAFLLLPHGASTPARGSQPSACTTKAWPCRAAQHFTLLRTLLHPLLLSPSCRRPSTSGELQPAPTRPDLQCQRCCLLLCCPCCRRLSAPGELQRAPPRPGHVALRSAAGPAGRPGLRARPPGSQQRHAQALPQGEQAHTSSALSAVA
jgi:hypothetical protein